MKMFFFIFYIKNIFFKLYFKISPKEIFKKKTPTLLSFILSWRLPKHKPHKTTRK